MRIGQLGKPHDDQDHRPVLPDVVEIQDPGVFEQKEDSHRDDAEPDDHPAGGVRTAARAPLLPTCLAALRAEALPLHPLLILLFPALRVHARLHLPVSDPSKTGGAHPAEFGQRRLGVGERRKKEKAGGFFWHYAQNGARRDGLPDPPRRAPRPLRFHPPAQSSERRNSSTYWFGPSCFSL